MGNGQGKQSFSSGHGKAYHFIETQHAHPLRRPISVLGLTDPNLNLNQDYISPPSHANHGRQQHAGQMVPPDFNQQVLSRRSFCADSDCSSGDHHHQQQHQHHNHGNYDQQLLVAHHNQRNHLINHQHALVKNKLLHASHETILNPSYGNHRKQLFHSPSPNHLHQRQYYQRQQSFLSDKDKRMSSASPSHHNHQQQQQNRNSSSSPHHQHHQQNLQQQRHQQQQHNYHQHQDNHQQQQQNVLMHNNGKGKYQQQSVHHSSSSHKNQSAALLRHQQSSASASSYISHEKYHQNHNQKMQICNNEYRRDVDVTSKKQDRVVRRGNHYVQKKVMNKVAIGNKILPPLPRSHSFHQILKPTENGQILAKKGTIRGFNTEISTISVSTSDLRNIVDHELDGNTIDVDTRNVDEDNVDSFPDNPELTAILKYRRCKSETDLLNDAQQNGNHDGHQDNNDNGQSQTTNSNYTSSVNNSNINCAINQKQVNSSSSDHYTTNVGKMAMMMMVPGHRSSPKPSVPNGNGVAGKIFKSKYRAPPPPVSSSSAPLPKSKVSSPSPGTPQNSVASKLATNTNDGHQHQQQINSSNKLASTSSEQRPAMMRRDNNQSEEDNNHPLPVQKSGTKESDINKRLTTTQLDQVKHHHNPSGLSGTFMSDNGHRLDAQSNNHNEKKKSNLPHQQKTAGINYKTPIHHASSSRLESSTSSVIGVSRIPISSRSALKGSSSNLLSTSNTNIVEAKNDRNLIFDSNQIRKGKQVIKVNSNVSSSRANQSNLNKKHAMTRSSSNLLSGNQVFRRPNSGVYNNLSASLEINREEVRKLEDEDAINLLHQFEASIICQRDNQDLIGDAQLRRQKSLNNLDDADNHRDNAYHINPNPYRDQYQDVNFPYQDKHLNDKIYDDADYRKLHPAFDDNFILKRATPSAGLDVQLTPINPSSRLRTPSNQTQSVTSDNHYYFAQLILPSPPASPPPEEINEDPYQEQDVDGNLTRDTNLISESVALSGTGGGTYSKRKRNILLPSEKAKNAKEEKAKYSPMIYRWLSEREASISAASSSDLNTTESDHRHQQQQLRRKTIENGVDTGFNNNVSKVSKVVGPSNVLMKRAASTEHLSAVGGQGDRKHIGGGQGGLKTGPSGNFVTHEQSRIGIRSSVPRDGGNSRVSSFVSPTRSSSGQVVSKNNLNNGGGQKVFKVASNVPLPPQIKRTNTTIGIVESSNHDVTSGPWSQAKMDNFILKRVTPNAGLPNLSPRDNPLIKNAVQNALPVPSIAINGSRSGQGGGGGGLMVGDKMMPQGSSVPTNCGGVGGGNQHHQRRSHHPVAVVDRQAIDGRPAHNQGMNEIQIQQQMAKKSCFSQVEQHPPSQQQQHQVILNRPDKHLRPPPPPTQDKKMINRGSSSSSSDKEMIEIKQRSPIYVSDSANYSADEEELVIDHLDQIIASAEQANGPESYIITDPSMYNMNLAFDDLATIKEKPKRNDCWTPMQDLSTSDESEDAIDDTDDGVISGDTGSDEVIREELTPRIPEDMRPNSTYVFGVNNGHTLDIKDLPLKARVDKVTPRGQASDKSREFIKRKVSSTGSGSSNLSSSNPYHKRVNDVDSTRFTLQNQIQTLLHHKLNNGGKKIYS